MPRRDDQSDRWPAVANGSDKRQSIHRARHLHVGKHRGNIEIALQQGDSLVGIRGLKNLEAEIADHICGVHTDQLFVLYDQNYRFAPGGLDHFDSNSTYTKFAAAPSFQRTIGDRGKIGQLLSNLVGNAITYGDQGQPIRVSAKTVDGKFVLEVTNFGAPISGKAMENLFRRHTRGDRPSQQRPGLGLCIASQIAKAHGGTLIATSDGDVTRFVFEMPQLRA